MNLPTILLTIRWLVWDTFRQSLASRVFWAMLLFTGLAVLFCLGVSVTGDSPARPPGAVQEYIPKDQVRHLSEFELELSGVDVIGGELTLAFGAFRVPLGRDRLSAVRHLQLILAGAVADTAGVFLALIWTAAFLPTFLEPQSATVLLAKPLPRWSLLAGKYLGVLAFVFLQAVIFVVGTWAALGLRTGVWDGRYLFALPLLVLHFAIFFSFSTLLAVWARSTVVCVLGSILFWLVSWGINYARHASVALGEQLDGSRLHVTTELGYWLMPKPADLGMILYDALQADGFLVKPWPLQTVQQQGFFSAELSVLSGLAFIAVMLALSARQLAQTDY